MYNFFFLNVLLFKKSIALSIFKFKSSPISKKKGFELLYKILFADAIKLVEGNKTSVSLLAPDNFKAICNELVQLENETANLVPTIFFNLFSKRSICFPPEEIQFDFSTFLLSNIVFFL